MFRRCTAVAAGLIFASMASGPLGSAGAWSRGDLESLPQLCPNGEKGRGALAIPNPADPDLAFSVAAADLGQGWRVRPFIKVGARSTVTIMDSAGPGVIQHIWMATAPNLRGNGRAGVLRFYWDGVETL